MIKSADKKRYKSDAQDLEDGKRSHARENLHHPSMRSSGALILELVIENGSEEKSLDNSVRTTKEGEIGRRNNKGFGQQACNLNAKAKG